jgi:hypothetical protein
MPSSSTASSRWRWKAPSAKTASRAIVVIGMHRSGTSAVARGVAALGVYLGDDFLDAQPENPTGYWEDRKIVELNERLLKALNLTWDGVRPIDSRELRGWRMWRLRREALRDLRRRFLPQPLWGFKDPRTIRILPFWQRVFRDAGVDDAYVVVIRNPASIAASLHARGRMEIETAQRLWLVHMVPFLADIADKPFVVVDYDLLINDPRAQLQRIAERLQLSPPDAAEIEHFCDGFLDPSLRHTVLTHDDIAASTQTGRRTRDAFLLLYDLASDQKTADAQFWRAWNTIAA